MADRKPLAIAHTCTPPAEQRMIEFVLDILQRDIWSARSPIFGVIPSRSHFFCLNFFSVFHYALLQSLAILPKYPRSPRQTISHFGKHARCLIVAHAILISLGLCSLYVSVIVSDLRPAPAAISIYVLSACNRP